LYNKPQKRAKTIITREPKGEGDVEVEEEVMVVMD